MPTVDDAKEQMEAALDAVRREFATVRTGKATPALLDTVRVDAYGSKMPLNQVATVSTPEASLLVVQPFDKGLLGDIERAIMTADLGLNPANDGNIIRVPVPPLNEERRREFVKVLHKMAEEARISRPRRDPPAGQGSRDRGGRGPSARGGRGEVDARVLRQDRRVAEAERRRGDGHLGPRVACHAFRPTRPDPPQRGRAFTRGDHHGWQWSLGS